MDATAVFESERSRLLGLATRVLADPVEAEDVVQQAWLRYNGSSAVIENLPAWLTTVTSRLCLDRLRARIPVPVADIDFREVVVDPAEDVVLAETVGVALQAVLDRLTPRERVAFVLHDSFGFDFETIAKVLDTTQPAARKLASRARNKIGRPAHHDLADWEVVDAFLAAARSGDFTRLLELLAPGVAIAGDEAAIRAGTPAEIIGQREVATFFNGAAAAARAVFIDNRPGAAWFQRGHAQVAFDFTITDGLVRRINFRAEPETLAQITGRVGYARHD